ncbi:membrane protein [Bordetella pertussis]|nr:membrane protein [Bordetella pertussis]CFU83182.1 membrane protein [Bordetella pertussis]CPN61931.1 membrane protein [Bordetella pertussis]
MLVWYAVVGLLGFAFEAQLGNRFAQAWEFYAITFSLFLVLGYPGFVYRYLYKKRRPARA